MTRTDSPWMKLWSAVNVITLAIPPSLRDPILLIPVGLCLTTDTFSELNSDSGITIRALYSVTEPAAATRTFNVSSAFAPTRYPSITFSGGASLLVFP